MNTERKVALAAGGLFILATAAGLSQFAFRGSLSSPDGLGAISADGIRITVAALLDLIMIGSILAIPVVLFPVLRRYREGLARGYLTARIFEGVVLIVGTIGLLSLLALSREFVKGGAADAPHYRTLGTLLRSVCDVTLVIGGQIVFSLTALILNLTLYKGRLVPRAISLWGLVGVPLAFASGVLVLFEAVADSSTLQTALILPLAVQEMVFAIWLMARGFSPSKDLPT